MKCLTVDNFDVIEGIRVVRDIRPRLNVGTKSPIFLGDELIGRLRLCLEHPSGYDHADMRFDRVFGDAFLQRASVAVDGAFRLSLVPETGEKSRERALVDFDVDINRSGVPLVGKYAYLGLLPSLEVKVKTERIFGRIDMRADEKGPDASVHRVRLCAVMSPGDKICFSVGWHRIDVRNMWRPGDVNPRPIADVSYDGDKLLIVDYRYFTASEHEVVETL